MNRWIGCGAGLVACALLLVGPAPAEAQIQSDGEFLFGAPKGTVSFRLGAGLPRAESDLFDYAVGDFTLERDDFTTLAFGVEVAVRASERVDFSFGIHHVGNSIRSEYRDFVDQDDFPIEQETEFRRTPMTVSAKYYFVDRGRSISRLAWIPSDWAPYVGAGGGLLIYSFDQRGDFIDFDTFEVFSDELSSTGVGPTGHVMGGLDVSVGPRFLLNFEGRYSWASAEVKGDFSGFEDVDLAGFQGTVGFAIRF